jgi:hypothetical protein
VSPDPDTATITAGDFLTVSLLFLFSLDIWSTILSKCQTDRLVLLLLTDFTDCSLVYRSDFSTQIVPMLPDPDEWKDAVMPPPCQDAEQPQALIGAAVQCWSGGGRWWERHRGGMVQADGRERRGNKQSFLLPSAKKVFLFLPIDKLGVADAAQPASSAGETLPHRTRNLESEDAK